MSVLFFSFSRGPWDAQCTYWKFIPHTGSVCLRQNAIQYWSIPFLACAQSNTWLSCPLYVTGDFPPWNKKNIVYNMLFFYVKHQCAFVVGNTFPPHVKTMIACHVCHAISMPAIVKAHSIPARRKENTLASLWFWQTSHACWGLIGSAWFEKYYSLIG